MTTSKDKNECKVEKKIYNFELTRGQIFGQGPTSL
jgi:hypothetical protein